MPPTGARRVTLRDIAHELGVSAKTVSNAFTRPDQLSAGLREQVLATADRLGYPGPDPLAAGLRRGRVGAVGVAYDTGLSYVFADPVAVQLMAGATAVAESARLGLLLIPGSADPARNAAAVGGALVDGLLAASLPDDDPVLRAALARRIPVVVIDQPYPDHMDSGPGRPPPWVGIDDRAAAATAARHLLELGHRRLGVVSFGLDRSGEGGLVHVEAQEATAYAVTRARLAGYRDALEAVGMHWSAVPVAQAQQSSPAGGALAARQVLATSPRPTALLCLSDRLAEGALHSAAALGLRVPEDLAVVGFDDAATAAALELTTMHHDHRRKGELAAQALLTLLRGSTPPEANELPTRLVVRRSTAPPA